MLNALALAFAQLGDPSTRRVLGLSVAASALGLVILAASLGAVLLDTQLVATGWLDSLLDLLGGVGALVLAWFLFPAVAGAVAGFLLDEVVDAVERRHYPGLPPARAPGWAEQAAGALRYFVTLIALNLVCLPLYLIPGINLVAYYGLNGYLLGREYFELVAQRRLSPAETAQARRVWRLKLFSAGITIAFLLTIPIVNLLMPVVASAFMVHLFHRMRRQPPAPSRP